MPPGGIQLRDNGEQGRLNNRNLRTRAHLTVKVDDVGRAHANAAVTCRAADIAFFRCAVNINVATKCICVLRFAPAQPDDPRYDRIATRRVHRNYFAGATTIFENGAGRSAVADFVRDFQLSDGCTKASRPIAQSEFGSRNRISGDEVAFLEQRQLLIADTDDDVVLSVARRSARSEDECGAERESVPDNDLEFSHVDLTRAQIGRILPQLPLLRQRFLPTKRRELARSLPRRVAYNPSTCRRLWSRRPARVLNSLTTSAGASRSDNFVFMGCCLFLLKVFIGLASRRHKRKRAVKVLTRSQIFL